MKTFLSCLLIAFLSYGLGLLCSQRIERDAALKAGAGYFKQNTGTFVYGSPPIVIESMMEPFVDPGISVTSTPPPMLPKRKPDMAYSPATGKQERVK